MMLCHQHLNIVLLVKLFTPEHQNLTEISISNSFVDFFFFVNITPLNNLVLTSVCSYESVSVGEILGTETRASEAR